MARIVPHRFVSASFCGRMKIFWNGPKLWAYYRYQLNQTLFRLAQTSGAGRKSLCPEGERMGLGQRLGCWPSRLVVSLISTRGVRAWGRVHGQRMPPSSSGAPPAGRALSRSHVPTAPGGRLPSAGHRRAFRASRQPKFPKNHDAREGVCLANASKAFSWCCWLSRYR